MKQYRHIAYFLLILLLLGGVANQTWAQTEVTYHILTLPMNHATGTKNTNASYDGYRVEAVKVVANNSTVVLPAHFKSPLAKNFTYYASNFITKGSAVAIYDNQSSTKYQLYTAPIAPYIKVTKDGASLTEEASTEEAWEAHSDGTQQTAKNAADYTTKKAALEDGICYFKMATLGEGDPVGDNTDIYVTYEYDPDNTVAKLDGTVAYNISMYSGTNASKKGFLALNRGRNNRVTIVPASKVSSSDLISDDFVYIDLTDTDMKTYWQSGDNWNDKNVTGSNFHFLFKYIGEDPYNITICTAYDKDKYYIEKFANDYGQVNKYYKESSIYFAPSQGNSAELFITSDVDRKYTNPSPSKSSLVSGVTWEDKVGWYRQLAAPIWNSFAILDVKYIDPNKTGHVFLATRTHNANGTFNGPTKSGSNYQYNYMKADYNAMKITAQTSASAVSNYTVDDEIYEIDDVNFKIKTQFGNEITAPIQLSKYSIEHEDIHIEDIPAELDRKYINYTGKFYKDAALTQEITSYNDAYDGGTGKYNVYVGYEVSNTIPFKAIKPSDSYITATWYELTDADSDQEDGKKLEYDDTEGEENFKNNGANSDYAKTSEFAFVGDPYELRVLYRDATETASANRYVGGSSTLGVSTSDYVSNSANISYGTSYTFETENLATGTKTLTFNVSGLKGDKKIKVTTGGTDASQIASISPDHSSVTEESSATQTYTVTLNANNGVAKTMTITIQEYDTDGEATIGTATVITIKQSTGGYLWGWEVPDDDTDGSFLLRKYGSTASTPMYWKWDTASAGNEVALDDDEPTRIKKMDLPEVTFTYNVVDLAGNIAIQADVVQTIFTPISGYASIPADIRSPFLADETVTFWSTYSAGTCSDETHETPNAAANIYITYTASHLSTKSIKLNNEQQFNVKLNEEYIYYDATAGKILSSSTIPGTEEEAKYYLWRLEGGDPYSVKIYNVGEKKYVKVASWADKQALGFDATIDNASRFIAMLSKYQGIYEVLAATGNKNYYRIGRPTEIGAETKMYSSYAHEADQLRFELSGKDPIKYTLIDKAGNELLEVSSNNPRLTLPAEYVSPLVDTYYYYPTKALAEDDVDTGNHTGNITEPDDDTDEEGRGGANKDNHVWVTYTVNNRVKFNDDNSPYMLKFWNGGSYKMEDGNDRLTSETIKAVYPYTNGDGNLNIYGQAKNEEQMNGGSSTRSRWIWYFDSDNNDPYHVKIHSSNTITYKEVKHPTYLQTYAVHFKQDAEEKQQRIVTGGALPGIASTDPTEYMILGTEGKFKLLTTNTVPVDLDGNGTTTGTGENVRQYVNSFEQYWKTYNMIKLFVLGIDNSTDAFSNDESTWVVPTDPASYRTTIEAKDWHSYDAIANAVRWNGYNDKSDGHEKKIVEKLEHWYQTFDMGDGTFDIESADIPPVLVLLDRHGWEIMRKPLPKYESYPYGDELIALKAYDSPMVEEYKFYNNATKGTGCHKYVLRMQDGAERDQIKVNGEHYTSTSLAILPPRTASGVIVGGAIQDLYVTYTVKEEYENSYKYHLELHEEDSTYTEFGTPSMFLILQNGRFARDNKGAEGYLSKPIFESSDPSGSNIFDAILSPSSREEKDVNTNVDTNEDGKFDNINLWYIQPNLNIDKEMGIKWAAEKNASLEPHTEYETKKEYKDKTGFDPYNIQLKNADTSGGRNLYLTSHMTTTTLTGGAMVGDYTGEGGSKNITLATWVDVKDADTTTPRTIDEVIVDEGYDHTNLQVTNQTFMAVSDAYGNMQLMPRFDHTQRINVTAGKDSRTTLANSVDYAGEAKVDDNSAMGPQTTFFVRPQVFEYHILDNDGQEALRYKTAGEYFPSITEHFMSPLATDYKFYYDHAASTTSISNKESYTVAATSSYFKKTATSEEDMTTTAKALTVLDDYYFKVTTTNYNYVKVTVTTGYVAPSTNAVYTTEVSDSEHYTGNLTATDDADMKSKANVLTTPGTYYYKINTYDYKKVTVTKAHSGSTDATYTTIDCEKSDWENAVASQRSAADEAAMQTAILALTKGTYYYQLGSGHYAYKKVKRADGKNTISICTESDYTSSGSDLTATDEKDFETKAKALSSDGTYYYKVGLLYNYEKVVVSGSNATLASDIAAGNDISDRQITGSFADADLTEMINQVYVRYSYDASSDDIGILQGKWLTIKLDDKDVKCGDADEIDPSDGTGVSLLKGTSKPDPVDEDEKTWQWKFLAAPIDPSSELHESPDPYAIKLFNRQANYCEDMREPNPMRIPIKVNGKDRFTLLSHPDGGYALAVNGLGTYSYDFLNGADMDTDDAATTATEASFTIKTGTISGDAQLLMTDDVTHTYTYHVINNASNLAVSRNQTNEEATENGFAPTLPVRIQTPLLYLSDYLYYGSADNDGDTYTVVDNTKLFTLYGLYDDVVYVRYNAYSEDNTEYMVPNKRNATGTGDIAVADDSKFTALNISGRLPYNIIWEGDKMMATHGNDVFNEGSRDLSGATDHIWRFFGGDPYAIQIRHGSEGKYDVGSDILSATADKTFMLLRHPDCEYGVLQVTGDALGNKLTGFGGSLTTADTPKYFIIFGLSTHKLIYRLVIARTCAESEKASPAADQYVDIPYSEKDEEGKWVSGKSPSDNYKLRIYGTTQRDLTNNNYQLGETIMGQTYCYDAGEVSIGDVLKVPTVFNRPNCNFFYYIDNIQTSGDGTIYNKTATDDSDYESKKADAETYTDDGYYYFKIGSDTYKRVQVKDKTALGDVNCTKDDYDYVWQDNTDLNDDYQGLKVTKLMEDPELIGSLVKINVAYAFQTGLETNAGEGFVTSLDQNLWYTFETKDKEATPYLAHYTNAWGLQAMPGLDTHYTNDYLWSPLGDVYGFRMYNRYMIKNSGGVNNVMTTDAISEGQNLKMAVSTSGREVYELLGSNEAGYFRIHPVINYDGDQYYIRKDPSDNYAKLSTSYSEWRFNLPPDLLKPYIERKGYVGGLTQDAYTANKTVLDKVMDGTATYADLLTVQGIVYNDANIVKYKPGYYRLHNQPDVSGISPVRYASGYLHDIEKTAVSGGIPMHFYSKSGVTTKFAGEGSLESGYTISNATRGDIPIVPTEQDPSTIFYFDGAAATAPANPTSTMQTQGLYVAANPMGDTTGETNEKDGKGTNRLQRAVMSATPGDAVTFSLMDIGGAVLLIHNGLDPATRVYLNFDQSNFFQRTAEDDTDMENQAKKFTSKGTYYFKIGESTYKKLTVTAGYVASPETNASYDTPEESTPEEWTKAADIYDLKYYHDSPTDDAKWCMEPANNKGLQVAVNNGGDDYYYSTFCAPYDVKLPDNNSTKTYYAYVCDEWNDEILHPKKVPAVTGSPSYDAGKFVPAGTPVIIRIKDESGSVKLSIEGNTPSSPLPSSLNIFSGKYLEQLLPLNGGGKWTDDVYTLGLPFISDVHKDADYDDTGDVTAELQEQAKSGLGFYVNATPYKEHDASESLWLRNNRYVLHNKIYYRAGSTGASARELDMETPEFVPIIFDFEEGEEESEELQPDGNRVMVSGDNKVYDLSGRCVANEQQVQDGSWWYQVTPGVYILNGKKFIKK